MRRILGEPRVVKGDEHVFYCPDPSHDGRKKLKLSVNLETDRFNCWSCGFKGQTLERLLRLEPGNPDLQEYLDGPTGKKASARSEPSGPPKLPEEMQTFCFIGRSLQAGPYRSYLTRRGISSVDIFRWKLGYCMTGDYRRRIVIP